MKCPFWDGHYGGDSEGPMIRSECEFDDGHTGECSWEDAYHARVREHNPYDELRKELTLTDSGHEVLRLMGAQPEVVEVSDSFKKENERLRDAPLEVSDGWRSDPKVYIHDLRKENKQLRANLREAMVYFESKGDNCNDILREEHKRLSKEHVQLQNDFAGLEMDIFKLREGKENIDFVATVHRANMLVDECGDLQVLLKEKRIQCDELRDRLEKLEGKS